MTYSKIISRITRYELEFLLNKPANILLVGLYSLVSLIIVIFQSFRQTYLGNFDAVALELVNFILPIFLVAHVLLILSPLFAKEKEHGYREIPETCHYGRRTRRLCKLIAVLYFLILLNLLYHLLTCIAAAISQPLSMWKEQVLQIGGEMRFHIYGTVWKHYIFAIFSLFFASIIIASLALLCSQKSKTVLGACAWSVLIFLLEYMLNRFTSWGPLQQFNIWQILTPYRFSFDVPFYEPVANVLTIGSFFTVLVIFCILNILKNSSSI